MIQINGNVSGDPGGKMAEAVIDNGHRYTVQIDGGRFTIQMGVEPSPFGAAIQHNGKQIARFLVPPPGSWEADQAPVSMDPPSLKFGPVIVPTARLFTSGRDFIQNGQRWKWKGASDFRLYQWFLEGRDIRPVLDQRRAAGVNILRVFGMYNGGIGQFLPSTYPAYFGAFPAFANLLAEYGLQFELTAMADCQTFLNNDQQHMYWGTLGIALSGIDNVVVELVNEYKKNGVDPAGFGPLNGILCSRGSGLSDEPGFVPGWNYHTWHGRRDWPKVLFSAEDMWYVGEGWGPAGAYQYPVIPIVHDEPIGFADENQPGRRSNDPYVARVIGGTSIEYGAGVTFHSDYGIQSQLWSPQVDLCARVMFDAVG